MKHRNPQSGVIFIAALILLAGMSVVVIALAHEVSLDLKMAASLVEADQALETAKVGIDKVVYAVNSDPVWRETYTSGETYGQFALGDGSFQVTLTDKDGDLADDPIDSVTVTSVAVYKGATRTVSATLIPPVHEAMMYLAYVWKAGSGTGDMEIKNGPRIYGDLCAANHVTLKDASAPDLRGDIYVTNSGNVSAALDDADTDIITLSSAPAAVEVDLDWFIDRGSRISPPVKDEEFLVEDEIISPTWNPYGFANSNGIYYIEGDRAVRFRRCHITATIVIATGKKVYFDEATVHAPAFSYYPALLSDNEVHYAFDRNLSEAKSDVDFNGDGDKADVFTPSISGVVFARKRIEGLQKSGGTNIVRFKGAFISEKIVLVGSGCIFEQDPSLASNLVSQFQGDGLKLIRGSLKIE